MHLHEQKVLIAMSGGVDSAVAGSLLQREGREVTGVYLCLRSRTQDARRVRSCCSPTDAEDARLIANTLGIPLITLPVAKAFRAIIADFVTEYACGRTPNPCIHCNSKIKFGLLFDLADALGVKYVATGHHARIAECDGRLGILRAKDRGKDQSYALFAVLRERLARVLLPVGELTGKEEVREIARRGDLPVHDKPESQEVCFVPDDGYVGVLEDRAPEALRGGNIVTSDGRVLGTHDGYARFTIGQRRGLRVATGTPLYVTQIDPETATVTAGPREELMATRLLGARANWHCDVPGEFEATVQVRYNHRGALATVRTLGPERFEVEFYQPVAAITPGQAAVVYQGDRLLGGGWIED